MTEEEDRVDELRFIPVDREISKSLLDILSDQSVRVDRLNELVSSDPVLLLEVVAAANGLKNIPGGKILLEGKASLLALGLERIRLLVQEMGEKTPHYDGDKAFWLKVIKQKSKRCGAVSSLVAQAVRPESIFECFTIGSLAYLGDMIALSKLGDNFVAALEEGPRRSKLKYRLAKDFNFAIEDETFDYLRNRSLPNVVPLALDPESSKLESKVQALKEICLSAIEFVDAFVEERLDRLAPGVSIPPKSYRRMLELSDSGYEALYESISAYLEKGEFVDGAKALEEEPEEALLIPDGELAEVGAEDAIDVIDTQEKADTEEEATGFSEAFESTDIVDSPVEPGEVVEFDEEFRPIETVGRRKYVSKSDRALPKFVDMFEDTESIDELLQRLLDMLVHQAPFECAALLVISPEERQAFSVISRGRDLIENGETIVLTDPLSPLLNVKSKVVSYSPKRKDNSPFGVSNYAVAPLEVKHDSPVILYADCGDGNILTFESRRLFRKVVDMLNNILPEMDGAIPDESKDSLSG